MDKLAKWCIWLRRRSFFRVAQRTFAVLMPIATVGAFSRSCRIASLRRKVLSIIYLILTKS